MHAVEQALTTGTANPIVDYVDLFAGLALAAGMVAPMLNALRVGLLPRWMAMLGMFAALLIFLPIGGAELQVVPAFWMVIIGLLFFGPGPGRPAGVGGRRSAPVALAGAAARRTGGAGRFSAGKTQPPAARSGAGPAAGSWRRERLAQARRKRGGHS